MGPQNLLQLHRVVNNLLHLRYSTTEFWICFDFRIYHSSEYTKGSEYIRVTQGFNKKYFLIDFWQYSEYALNSEYDTVLNILGLHTIVTKISHHRYLTGFWICVEFWIYQCYTGFCRKQPVIDVWQVSEYSLGS